MTVTATEAGTRSALPRVRHGILAAALLAVAALRWYQGDDVWAAVFGLAGAVEVYIAVVTRRHAADEPAPVAAAPAPAELDLALVRHLQTQRLWTGLAVVALVGAVVVLAAEPSLAIVLAVVGLGCLFRVRRTRRSVETLRLLRGRR